MSKYVQRLQDQYPDIERLLHNGFDLECNFAYTQELVDRDSLATQAALWLVTEDSPALDEIEEGIMARLVRDGHIADVGSSIYFERQSVEHGVVHVHIDHEQKDPTGFWIEIDPRTGRVHKY